MIINNYFGDETKTIRERINEMPVLNCIENYVNYIHNGEHKGFEKEYATALNNRFKSFLTKAFNMKYGNSSKEKLIKMLVNAEWEGIYGYSESDSYDILNKMQCDYSDDELHELIKTEMLETLEALIAEKTQSAKDKKIQELKRHIESYESDIERYERYIADYKNRLEQSKKDLSELV